MDAATLPPRADWRRNQAAVTVATFIGFTGFTLVMPFLPLYFEHLGVHDPAENAIWSGVSLGITPAITAAMAPFWARVADRYGRKLMVVRSLAAFVLIMAVMAAVQRPWHVLALRALLGFFAGYGQIAITMAAESAPAEYIAVAIGWVHTAQRLGPAVGPVVGGVLAATVGLREAFVVAAAVYLLAVLAVVFGYDESIVARVPADVRERASFAVLRRVPAFLMLTVMVFGLQLVDRSFGPVLPLYLGEIGTARGHLALWSGVLFTVTAATAACGNQAADFLLKRLSVPVIVSGSCAMAGVGALGFFLAPPMPALVTSALLFGLGLGVAETTIYTAASQAVAPEVRGMAFGYLMFAYLLGLAVSPVVSGVVGSVSMRAVFMLDVIGLAVMTLIVRARMRAVTV